MNVREELYLSGATLTVAHVYPRKGGRRVPVIDPYRRARGMILGLLLDGMTPREVARHLDIPLGLVCSIGIRALAQKSASGPAFRLASAD